jgi:hypothetical protein
MAEPRKTIRAPITLAERFDKYKADIEGIVARGIEHSQYELTRSATIVRENLAERLEFVKLVHGLANAHLSLERFIVIGADQKDHKFINVANADEFDPAKVLQILSKYLDPPPRLEVFNKVLTPDGEAYVFIVLSPDQPRPIVAICEGRSNDKLHFENGDIWIKKDTGLQRVLKTDLDAMYEPQIQRRINDEAESRARGRLEQLRESPGPAVTSAVPSLAPKPELLVGPKEHLRRFVEAAIGGGDLMSFKMLIEMAHDNLVEKWETHQAGGPGLPPDPDKWVRDLSDFHRDSFLPALDSVVEMGLLVIKFDAPRTWLEIVAEVLVETFEACRGLDRLKSGNISQRSGALPFARPAYEIYIGLRTLATYAVVRNRFTFLEMILPKFVRYFTVDDSATVYVPVIFWPFFGSLALPDMREGRAQTLWAEHVDAAWNQYFVSFDKFLTASSQLEFILEFSSYVLEEVNHEGVMRFKEGLANKRFANLPDFWTNRLDPTVPMAERFYDVLQGNPTLTPEFAVEKQAFDIVFKGLTPEDRLSFLGGFLAYLKTWQAKAMMQSQRFPFMFDWPGRLKGLVVASKAKKTK